MEKIDLRSLCREESEIHDCGMCEYEFSDTCILRQEAIKKELKIVEALTNGIQIETSQEKAQPKEAVNKYGVKVGDIFYMSWGYDQTNVDYFQVVELKGECMIKIREIACKTVETETSMSEYVSPVKDGFLKSAFWCKDKKNENDNNDGIWKKVISYNPNNQKDYFLNMTSYANAYPIVEKSKHFTSSWA